MNIKRHLSLWKVLIIAAILEIIILLYDPDIAGTSNQDNLTWIMISANFFIIIMLNGWEVIYLKSNTVCPGGVAIPLTTGGETHQKGPWFYAFGGDTALSAGYNTHMSGPAGLQREGRDIIAALAFYCHRVGGVEGSEKRHIFITGQTEKRSPQFTPFEIKSKRDERTRTPLNIFIAYFMSKEYSRFQNHSLTVQSEGDTTKSKRINITSLVSKNLSSDTEYDTVRSFLLGDSTPIIRHVEQFMSLLKVKSPTTSGWSSWLRQDTREEDGET